MEAFSKKCTCVFITILLIGSITIQAQSADSLKYWTDLAKTDSLLTAPAAPLVVKVLQLEKALLSEVFAKNVEVRIMHDISTEKLPTAAERAAEWFKEGQFFYNVSWYEQADQMLYKAQQEVETLSGEENEAMRANIMFVRGQNLIKMSDFVNATQLLTEAGSYFEKKKDYAKLIKVYNAQVAVYQAQMANAQSDEPRALLQEHENYFLKKLETLHSEMEDPVLQADCLICMANHEMNKQDWEKAKKYLALLGAIVHDCNYTEGIIAYYSNSGFVEEKMGNIREGMALQYKAYEIALEAGNMAYAAEALANAAFDASKIGEYELMRRYSLKGIELAREYDIKAQLWCFLDILSTLAYEEKNYKQAIDYRNECIDVYMDLCFENNADQINQYVARCASLQKENKINELQYKSRQKSQLIFFLTLTIFLAIIIFVIVVLYRRRIANKQKQIARQRIQQLEQEKQLVATQAILEGENAERSRLAKDLHDGLGSMLSAVKINLPEMKSGVVLESDDVMRFQKAINMLDDSISELRRVAHHMMPESLMRYGLKASLTDFCHATPSIEFHHFGNDQRLDSKLEIAIYRAAHEIINNALKHAEATQINVQLVQENDRISLSVHDNGKGFDTTLPTKGMGLENIRNRIAANNGKMTIYSSPETGTEVNVEIDVLN